MHRSSRCIIAVLLITLNEVFACAPAIAAQRSLFLYSDAGTLLGARVFTWPQASECSRSRWNGQFKDQSAPEGLRTFFTSSTCPYVGWGIFKQRNLSAFAGGELRFKVKSSTPLLVELEGPRRRKAGVLIPSTQGQWRDEVIPIRVFSRVNLSKMFGLFLATALQPSTFYIDDVKWVSEPAVTASMMVDTEGLCPGAGTRTLTRELDIPTTLYARMYAGYTFAGWTGSFSTNSRTMTFTMTSNLTFSANYVDTSKPRVQIKTPMPGARVTDALLTVSGVANDTNGCIARVLYQLNSGSWNEASGTTNWTAQMQLTMRTNALRVYAVDAVGHTSVTSTTKYLLVIPIP
jgi:uncharacterized repeat protein (TIGR02543 family)